MLLRTIVYIFLIAVALIAAAVAAAVLTALRKGKTKTWVWQRVGVAALGVVALAVAADAFVLVRAVWDPDARETALVYATPESSFELTVNAAPTPRPAVAPVETERPAPSMEATLTVLDKMCDYEDTVRTVYDCYIRKYPDTGADKLDYLDVGVCLNRVGINPDGWSKVSYNGTTGYLPTDWLTSVDRDENEIVGYEDLVYVKTAGPMYSEPDSGSEELLQAAKKMTFTRTGITCSGWSQIEYEGETYYMLSSLLLTQ